MVKTDYTYQLPEVKATTDKRPDHVGLASWGTTVHYKDAQLLVNGKEVSISDFGKWTTSSGEWKAQQGEFVQTSTAEPAMTLAPTDIKATKYSFRVKAMKESGDEGFMFVVGYKDKNVYQWYNVAGWGNTQSNVEQANGGGRMQLASAKRMKVENGRWYDLQVDVDGDNIKCSIDGESDFDVKLQNSMMSGVYASTTFDEKSNEMIVKVVNVGAATAPATINLANFQAKSARLIRLSSASGEDENSLDNPTRIAPVTEDLKVKKQDKVTFQVQPYSVNIIRIAQ